MESNESKPVSAAISLKNRSDVSSLVSTALASASSAQIFLKGSTKAVASVLVHLGEKGGAVSAVLSLSKT